MAIKYGTSSPDTVEADIGDLNATLFGYAEGDPTEGGPLDNDTLIGGAGYDTLHGGAGDDIMIGGEGGDTYYVDSAGDQIVEDTGNTTDFDQAYIDGVTTFNMATSGIELVTVTGSTGVTITGTDGANSIVGGEGADTINAGAGADQVQGTGGNDVIYGGDGADNLDGGDGDDEIYGNAGNDSLTGGAGGDYLEGGDGNDNYLGVDAGDVIVEHAISDAHPAAGYLDEIHLAEGVGSYSLAGLEGVEMLRADYNTASILHGNDTQAVNGLYGSSLGDQLYGHGGMDVLQGNAGDDLLNGGSGYNEMNGGDGNDTYVIDRLDTVLANPGALSDGAYANVSVIIEDGTYSYSPYVATEGIDRLEMRGIARSEVSFAVQGNDLYIEVAATGQPLAIIQDYFQQTEVQDGSGNSYFVYDRAVEEIYFAVAPGSSTLEATPEDMSDLIADQLANPASSTPTPNEIIGDHIVGLTDVYAGDGADVIEGTSGDDILRGEAGRDMIAGRDGNDTLIGGAGSDTLEGGIGNDTLDGGAGAFYDALQGGDGDDTYIFAVGYGHDVILDTSEYANTMDGGAADRLVLSGLNPEDVTFSHTDFYLLGVVPVDSLKITVNSSPGDQVVVAGQFISRDANGNPVSIPNLGVETIEFANGVIWNQADILAAANGNPPDYEPPVPPVVATEGNDVLTGTALDDDGIPFNDIVNNPQSAINGLGGDDTISMLAGSDIALGGAGNDTISGGDGADILGGSDIDLGTMQFMNNAGTEVLAGNAGDDLYFVVNDTTTVVEAAGEGTDSVYQNVLAYVAPDHVENVFAAELDPAVADAEGIADPMGGFFANAAGAPVAVAITGNALDNVLVGNALDNTLSGLEGNDTLFGQDGSDLLDGGTGADRLVGGTGDDIYLVDDAGDVVVELDGEGYDLVQASASFDGSATAVEDIYLEGSADINATGNLLDNTLLGNDGANRLDGGAGVDVMIGGLGNDTYVVDNAFDAVVENAASGTDTVESSISYALGSNVENLVLTGTGNINGTGNGLANTLVGNSGNNVLAGGAGSDTMIGGAGNDTYVVQGADTITELAGEGVDTVQSATSYVLVANVENLTLTGTANVNGTGNALNNVITGNSGNNTLNGQAGADTLIGGAGNDTYIFGAGDTIIEQAGGGIDQVNSNVSVTLSANVENLTLTGAGNISGTGNAQDNVITGNAGANVLTGGAGNDTLAGGNGTDTLIGGTGNDTYVLNRGNGADTVVENDTTAGNHDVAVFGASGTAISAEQLWFAQSGNDLVVSVVGTTDQFTFTNWYNPTGDSVDEFRVSDGSVLTDTQVQNLVTAMASFTPPPVGTTNLDAGYQPVLDAIAANWS